MKGGDFNMRFTSIYVPIMCANLISSLHSYGLTQHITTPARTNNSLDLIFTIDQTPEFAHVLVHFSSSDESSLLFPHMINALKAL